MSEFDLIEKYFSRAATGSGVVHGVGDDAAVLVPEAGRHLVAAIDTLVEGVHFPSGFDAADLGYRLVAVNLSDFASMGARPRWMTLALTLRELDEAWLEGFSTGLYGAAGQYGVALVGGDTTRGQHLVMTISMLGDIPAGRALTRSGARLGDDIYVSGQPGDAAAGLRLLLGEPADDTSSRRLMARFRRPEPRVELGRALVGIASACIDVSDGLHDDLEKLVGASGLGANVDVDRLPISDDLRAAFPDEIYQLALGGGDDYELCFTVPPGRAALALQAAQNSAVRITRIGRVVPESGIACHSDGNPVSPKISGYDHFRSSE